MHYVVSVSIQEVTPAQPAAKFPDTPATERKIHEMLHFVKSHDTYLDAVARAIEILEIERGS